MKRLVLLCLRVFLFVLAVALRASEIPDDSVITLERHTCESHCPVYRVVLFGDGTVIYYGEYYVRRTGVVPSHIDPELFRSLIASAERIGYFSLKSEYGYHGTNDCDYRIPDAPIVSTSVTAGSKSHGIIHHHRCGGPIPAQLSKFEDEIEKVANTMRFTK